MWKAADFETETLMALMTSDGPYIYHHRRRNGFGLVSWDYWEIQAQEKSRKQNNYSATA